MSSCVKCGSSVQILLADPVHGYIVLAYNTHSLLSEKFVVQVPPPHPRADNLVLLQLLPDVVGEAP
jgi:hypothetical protein